MSDRYIDLYPELQIHHLEVEKVEKMSQNIDRTSKIRKKSWFGDVYIIDAHELEDFEEYFDLEKIYDTYEVQKEGISWHEYLYDHDYRGRVDWYKNRL